MTDETAKPWRILEGDCAVTLADLPAESIDACVTDTPYGLSTLLDPPNLDRKALWRKLTEGTSEAPIKTLMRAWLDTGDNPKVKGRGFMGKEWDALVPSPNTWRAVWRVLKPGAYCFAFGGTRTADLISLSLRFADFEVDDMLSWLYGQGFPKRVRLDLKIDQHFGIKPGRQKHPRSKTGFAQPGPEGWHNVGATHPEAARFVGWDRALRPGLEPILVAVKPLRGTVAANALRYGTGGLHVDACRLPRGDVADMVAPQSDPAKRTRAVSEALLACAGGKRGHNDAQTESVERLKSMGGYPPNVALDEETAEALDRMRGALSGRGNKGACIAAVTGYNGGWGEQDCGGRFTYDAGGGASRFFYVAKASSSERDAGLGDLPPLSAGERCDREDDSAGVNGYAGTRGEGGRNIHPTLKPIALMRWLCRLAAPPGAHDPDLSKRPVILDPFFGSGSTGVAALAEGLRVVGCEMMPEYVEIARRRCQHAYALPPDDPERAEQRMDTKGQKSLF